MPPRRGRAHAIFPVGVADSGRRKGASAGSMGCDVLTLNRVPGSRDTGITPGYLRPPTDIREVGGPDIGCPPMLGAVWAKETISKRRGR